MHPGKTAKVPYIRQCLEGEGGVFVAASDYVKVLPCSVARWIPGPFLALGTDGFGRSDGRAALRDFFEVDARHIALAALTALTREGRVDAAAVVHARDEWGIDPERPDPVVS